MCELGWERTSYDELLNLPISECLVPGELITPLRLKTLHLTGALAGKDIAMGDGNWGLENAMMTGASLLAAIHQVKIVSFGVAFPILAFAICHFDAALDFLSQRASAVLNAFAAEAFKRNPKLSSKAVRGIRGPAALCSRADLLVSLGNEGCTTAVVDGRCNKIGSQLC